MSSEIDKNKIDTIFKNGLENYPKKDGLDSNWLKLEKMLDEKKSSNRIFFMKLMAVSAVACLVLFYFWNTFQNSKEYNPLIESNLDSKRIVDNDTITNDSIANQNIDSNLIANVNSVGVQTLNFTPVFKSSYRIKNDNVEYDDNISIEDISLNDSTNHDLLNNQRQANLISVDKHAEVEDELLGDINPLIHEAEASDRETKTAYRNSFTLLTALDLTRVEGASKNVFSQSLGILYTRKLSNLFSVSSGLIYSIKNYESPYSFYKPTMTYNITHLPNDVNADCRILSVPILLNYHMLKTHKFNLSINSGLSNLFMLKEKYNFLYLNSDMSSYTKEYTIKGKNQHYFSMLDLSLSLEHNINNKIKVGIRPFWQVPLQGVGYGNMKLESKGIALTFGLNQ